MAEPILHCNRTPFPDEGSNGIQYLVCVVCRMVSFDNGKTWERW